MKLKIKKMDMIYKSQLSISYASRCCKCYDPSVIWVKTHDWVGVQGATAAAAVVDTAAVDMPCFMLLFSIAFQQQCGCPSSFTVRVVSAIERWYARASGRITCPFPSKWGNVRETAWQNHRNEQYYHEPPYATSQSAIASWAKKPTNNRAMGTIYYVHYVWYCFTINIYHINAKERLL